MLCFMLCNVLTVSVCDGPLSVVHRPSVAKGQGTVWADFGPIVCFFFEVFISKVSPLMPCDENNNIPL